MNAHPFESMIRRAGDAVSRRRSVLALSGAAVATSALGLAPAEAGKDAKKAKKRKKKKCKRQIDQCRAVMLDECEAAGPECDGEIQQALLACCDPLKTCKGGESVDCFFTVLFAQ